MVNSASYSRSATSKMSMMSTAGHSGLRRESIGNGGRMNDCQVAHALRPAPAEPDRVENMEDADLAAHYLTICELVQRHVGDGTVLDIGCGSGRLYHYLTEHAGMPVGAYTGIDSSGAAVRQAAARFPDAGFGRRDYDCESVASRFDCVIFNDSLHCYDEPAAILDKCVDRNMHACSVMIVALALGQHDAIWRLLAQRYRVVDEQVVIDGNGNAWMLQALKLPGSHLGC
jgi:2-polyprenyl-3-methyl-5-hydroxy-6-metoxy-1,4-benzoquinol methylase